MKKGLKIGLIVGLFILIAGGTRAGLTKAGVIPNWLGIEVLCSGEIDYIRKNDVSQGNIEKEDCSKIILGTKDYNRNSYKKRCKTIYGEDCNPGKDLLYDIIEPVSLTSEKYYNEWISSEFSEYKEQIQNFEKCKAEFRDGYEIIAAKPIIYLYPTTETEIHVKLGSPENLSHTYPKYNSEKGRNVIAQPNGDLEDIDTGRKLYALYREGKSNVETNFDEGFVVAGKDIIPFLEEKLAILGLNEREAEEFIVYWLPQMENNEWNLIRFETKAEQDENMLLNITPTPDTVIRVMMDWKAVDELIDIPEQQLTTPERNGFTVVEWGGSPRN